MYFIIDEINKYIGESNRNKYLTLVPFNEDENAMKRYEELWSKVKHLIGLIANTSVGYDEKHMKIKFNSDYDLSLKMKTVVISLFHEGNKYYPKVS